MLGGSIYSPKTKRKLRSSDEKRQLSQRRGQERKGL